MDPAAHRSHADGASSAASAAPSAPYRRLLERLDAWTADAHARHPGIIPCRAGCTACCHGPFDISPADAELLRDGFAALDDAARERILTRARASAAAMRTHAPEWDPARGIGPLGEDGFDDLAEACADLPCPLLEPDGACALYAHRPSVCRLMGLAMRTDDGDVLDNHCPIQHEFPAYAALPPQRFAMAAFEQGDAECQLAAARRLHVPEAWETTVTGALLMPATPPTPKRGG